MAKENVFHTHTITLQLTHTFLHVNIRHEICAKPQKLIKNIIALLFNNWKQEKSFLRRSTIG